MRPAGSSYTVPAAFTPEGLAQIYARVAPADLIEVPMEDACHLAANAVCVGSTIVTSYCGGRLHRRLAERGYQVRVAPLPSFLRSGGGAFCLTLRLDRQSDAGAIEGNAAVA